MWCANASDGIFTAHPTLKGKQLSDIKGKHGAPFGETITQDATEGTIRATPTGGRALAQTSRSRRPPFTRWPVIRFAQSAITRNNLPGSYARFWHKADIDFEAEHVGFRG